MLRHVFIQTSYSDTSDIISTRVKQFALHKVKHATQLLSLNSLLVKAQGFASRFFPLISGINVTLNKKC